MSLTNDPTCKSLILLVSGYNLKVRGSNSPRNQLLDNKKYFFKASLFDFFCQIVFLVQDNIKPSRSSDTNYFYSYLFSKKGNS